MEGKGEVLDYGCTDDLLGIRKMNKVSNARIREFRGVTKGVDERFNEVVLL